MPDIKISAMTAVSSVADADTIPVVQGGVNKRATRAQVVASCQPLDPTLTALSGLDDTPGFAYQTGPDSFIKTDLTPAHMAALRTFVKPYSAATNVGGGVFQCNLFRVTLGIPDAAAGMLVVVARIIDAATPKTGAYYFEVPIAMQRDSLEFGGNIATVLARAHFDGSTGGGATSIGFSQAALSTSAPNVDISLIIQPVNFTNPAVSMSAVFVCPGDVVVSAL